MQPTPTTNTNPLTEIGVILISVVLIAAATILLVLGKIDFTAATFMLLLVASIFGVNGALKASSPAQQAQMQQLTSQVLSVLPNVVTAQQQLVQPTLSPTDIATAIRQQVPQLAMVTQQPAQAEQGQAPLPQLVPPEWTVNTRLPQPSTQSEQPYTWSQPSTQQAEHSPAPVFPPMLNLPSTFPDSLELQAVQPTQGR